MVGGEGHGKGKGRGVGRGEKLLGGERFLIFEHPKMGVFTGSEKYEG